MLIRRPSDIPPSSITDPAVYAERRQFIQGMPLAAGALGVARHASAADAPGASLGKLRSSPYSLIDEKPTPFQSVTTYGNFYEFGPDKVYTGMDLRKYF